LSLFKAFSKLQFLGKVRVIGRMSGLYYWAHFRRAAHRSGQGLRAWFCHAGGHCVPGCAASFVYNTPNRVRSPSLPETGLFGVPLRFIRYAMA
jgi:hypothetical protein